MTSNCAQPKPRKPISYSSGQDQSISIAFNRKLYAQQDSLLAQYRTIDSTHHYHNSKFGYWFTYIKEVKSDSIFPKKGDIVKFNYNISDIKGNLLYSKKELGLQSYTVDQEEIIQGLQDGIKNLNKGEKATFLLPSHKAYSYHGDENKIGPNTPIVVELEVIEIIKN